MRPFGMRRDFLLLLLRRLIGPLVVEVKLENIVSNFSE